MLQQAYGEDCLALCNVTSGIGISNQAERLLKMTQNLDGFPRQWMMITLRKCLL